MSTATAPGLVERDARIFRFGTFPGRGGWSCSRAEFEAANGTSGTIPVGVDPVGKAHYHGKESWLDGETGFADWYVDGDQVLARLRVPDWVNRMADKAGAKVSSVLGRAGKELRKIDLVANPHIPDAVLFADGDGVVLLEGDEPEGEVIELCEAEMKGFAQGMHEILASHHPGLCDGTVAFADDGDAARLIRQAHDYAIHEGGAYCPGMHGHRHEGEIQMSDAIDEVEYDFEQAVVSFSDDQLAELPQRDQAFIRSERANRARIARLEAEADDKDAVGFADLLTVGDGAVAMPFQRANIIFGYKAHARQARESGDVVEFADEAGKPRKGSPLDAFKAGWKSLPRLELRKEKAAGASDAVELADEPGGEDEARRAADRERRKKANQDAAKQRNPASAG